MFRVIVPSVKSLSTGIRMLLIATVLLGVGYPLAMFAVGRLMPFQTDGSPVVVDGRVVGSQLIGQSFEGEEWFHSRPSNAGDGYDMLATGASNLSPENPELAAIIEERRAAIAAEEGVDESAVPADAVTASASGLDPDISVAYADLQVARVAAARGLDEQEVVDLVAAHTVQPDLGFIGEPRVNVLLLNVALDELAPIAPGE